MKIALPTRDGQIDDHFGHCDHYTLMTLDDEKNIVKIEAMDSPEGCGCKSNIAPILAEKGVKIMLAGNMGQGAVNILQGSGIQVVRGCSGSIQDVAAKWIAGDLQDNLITCDHHDCDHHDLEHL
ncbi:dinitrogenase iron-molybdenum cofactor biosynthesis protein [Pseudodesulfovibrio cashew]|uniref:Dinitrogenase iron-molybdenum cofactor biosynthesis protein n=1 Tax=Pseudodesulfovibrio cashew TaxID=2678688 RepID=A0A6I6JLF6_9BACT|nr:NifB/NifX family molybdenum-iron cluster-binding protein [Pseudodesulfovibrio cashew]QGY41122.1 dinitrogenase iron-molybdenum cofactor biosynthesis protein [Pseudodesulfovibrio cashew]